MAGIMNMAMREKYHSQLGKSWSPMLSTLSLSWLEDMKILGDSGGQRKAGDMSRTWVSLDQDSGLVGPTTE